MAGIVELEITFLGTQFREEKVILFQQCSELKKIVYLRIESLKINNALSR